MIEVENTDVNIVRNFIPMRNHMPASAYGLKAISDWLFLKYCTIIKGKRKKDIFTVKRVLLYSEKKARPQSNFLPICHLFFPDLTQNQKDLSAQKNWNLSSPIYQ